MVLDCSYEYLIEKLGHDGSEILWPELPEPICRRAFHIEEIQYIALGLGVILVPFVKAFQYAPAEARLVDYDFSTMFDAMLLKYNAVLLGRWKRGNPHAVAWNANEKVIYDPEGFIHCDSDSFELDQCYAAIPRIG